METQLNLSHSRFITYKQRLLVFYIHSFSFSLHVLGGGSSLTSIVELYQLGSKKGD